MQNSSWRWVGGFLPARVCVAADLADGVAGYEKNLTAYIRAGYEGDAGLIAHELLHVRQWYVMLFACVALALLSGASIAIAFAMPPWTLMLAVLPGATLWSVGVHGRLYASNARYRLYCESRAYREQLRHYPDDSPEAAEWRINLFADFIATRYRLNVSRESVLQLLRG